MKKLTNTFITGITAILPLSITLYVLYKFFMFIDGLSSRFIADLIGIKIVGLGFVTNILLILLIGYITKNLIGQKLLHVIEKLISKVPMAQTIYGIVKEVINSLLSKDKKSFQQTVAVRLSSSSTFIGFLTNEKVTFFSEEGTKKVAVFIPTTPNPTSGLLLFVEEDKIEYLDLTVDEAMKIIVSLGVILPEKIHPQVVVSTM